MRFDGRQPEEKRPVSIQVDFVKTAAGSCLIATGGTRVISQCRGRRSSLSARKRTGLADGGICHAAGLDKGAEKARWD